jgi:hypothetical protein
MTGRRASCTQMSGGVGVGTSRSALAPAALFHYGEGKTMHVATKRSVIAAAAIAAAGLFGSLPYEGASVAQQGVPTVHQEVALVDAASAAVNDAQQLLLDAEGAVNGTLSGLTADDNGLLDVLYTAVGSDLADSLLLADGSGAIYGGYLDIFNGAATAGYNGFISNTLAFEAELNNILGVPMPDAQAYLLDQFNDLFIGAVPASLGDPELGDSFIPDLVAIANSQYTLASNDLIEYTSYLFTNFDDVLGGLTQIDLGELLGNVTESLTTLTTGLTDNVNDLLTAIIGLL